MTFLPGWNSIESAAWLHDLFEKSSLFLVALLAVTVGVAYLYGQRKDYLSDEAARAAEAARPAAPVERKAGTAPAPVPTPDIPRAAATNPPVGEAETLSGPGAQTRVAGPQAPVTGTPSPAAEEGLRTRDEREARSAAPPAAGSAAAGGMRKSGPPGAPPARRHLSADQKTRLHAFLKDQPKGRLVVRINPSVPDAANYGIELARFFKHEAGWAVRVDNSPFTAADPGGMWLALRSADAIPPATGALHAALAHAHVPVRPQPVWDPGGPAFNEIWIVIGKRA